MASKEAYLHNDVPPGGEPLEQRIAASNEALLRREAAERLERVKLRLDRRALGKLTRRAAKLRDQLNKAKYNQLVMELDKAAAMWSKAKANAHAIRTERAKERVRALAAKGRDLKARLDRLQPLAEEFRAIQARLNAHQHVVQLEQEQAENRKAFRREVETWKPLLQAAFKQNPKLHHVRHEKDGREYIDIPFLERPKFRPDKVYFPVRTSKQTFIQRLFGRWSPALPYGVNPADLVSEDTLLLLSLMTGRTVSVVRNQKTQNIYYVIHRVDGNNGFPERVLYGQVLDFYPDADHTHTPFCAGVDEDGRVHHFDFDTFPHILLAGASGGRQIHLHQPNAGHHHPDEHHRRAGLGFHRQQGRHRAAPLREGASSAHADL